MFSLPPLAKCPWPIPHWSSWHFLCSRNDRRQVPLGFTRLCWDFHTICHVNMKQQLGWRELIKIATSPCKQAAWKRGESSIWFFFSESRAVFLGTSTLSERAKQVYFPSKWCLGGCGEGQTIPALPRSPFVGIWYPGLLTGRSHNLTAEPLTGGAQRWGLGFQGRCVLLQKLPAVTLSFHSLKRSLQLNILT